MPKEEKEGLILFVTVARGKPRLIFYAHIDVVPAEGWGYFQTQSPKWEGLWWVRRHKGKAK